MGAYESIVNERDRLNEVIAVYDENNRLRDGMRALGTTNTMLMADRDLERERADRLQRLLTAANAEIERLRTPPLPTPAFAFTTANTPDIASVHEQLERDPFEPAPFATYPLRQAYSYGRGVRDKYAALVLAGDTSLLDCLETTMNAYEPEIVKAAISNVGNVDESLMAALILLHATVMKHNNREWQKWLDLFHSRYPKGVPVDDITHCTAANIESYAYLYALTGDDAYARKRDALLTRFQAVVSITTINEVWRFNERGLVTVDALGKTNLLIRGYQTDYLSYIVLSTLLLRKMRIVLVDQAFLASSFVTRAFRIDGKIGFYLDGSLRNTDAYTYAKWRGGAFPFLASVNERIREHNEIVTAAADSLMLACGRVLERSRNGN